MLEFGVRVLDNYQPVSCWILWWSRLSVERGRGKEPGTSRNHDISSMVTHIRSVTHTHSHTQSSIGGVCDVLSLEEGRRSLAREGSGKISGFRLAGSSVSCLSACSHARLVSCLSSRSLHNERQPDTHNDRQLASRQRQSTRVSHHSADWISNQEGLV